MKNVIFGLVLIAGSSQAHFAIANPPTSKELIATLKQTLDIKVFRQPMDFHDFLGLLNEKCAAKKWKIEFAVDREAYRSKFENGGLGGRGPTDGELNFMNVPDTMRVDALLRKALSQLPGELTFLVRDGFIEITSKKKASLPSLLNRTVIADFSKVKLADVLSRLSGQTGVSINIDTHVKEKADLPITATFRNDVTLESALFIITEMADLQFVIMPSGIYVTTEERANLLRKRIPKREFENPGL